METSARTSKLSKVVIYISLGLIVVSLVVYFVAVNPSLFNFSKDTAPTAPNKGEVGYEETQNAIATVSKEVVYGQFLSIDEGKLFFTAKEGETSFNLTDEIAYQCSEQDLTNIDYFKFDSVYQVKVYTVPQVSALISKNTSFVGFLTEGEDAKLHTITVTKTDCKI